jgi:hypothetical protein
MMEGLEIRKANDGRVQARRVDGKPMTIEDREKVKRLASADVKKAAIQNHRVDERVQAVATTISEVADDLPRAWVIEEFRDTAGKLQAVKICRAFLQDHLYVIIDPGFIPPEPLAVYSTEEIEAMADKSPEQVLEIHKVKIVFRGARVIQ